MNDVASDVERLQVQITVMRTVLESTLIGAKHEAYFLSDRDPNPCWHEDDWAGLIPEIEVAIQLDDSDEWQKRIHSVQQLIVSALAWRSANVELKPASEIEEKRRQREKAQLTEGLIKAVDAIGLTEIG